MKNNGIKPGISPRSRHDHRNIDGKGRPSTSPASSKKPSKYTIVRTQQDIHELEKLREVLRENSGHSRYNTDAEIYRDLPRLYHDAVERASAADHQVSVLTAELAQLDELRRCFCRIIELCKEKKKP